MASVRRPKSINASLRWNASVRRPEPSHRHSMLAPMVSVHPDWGREGQHRVARWWLRPPYSGFHLWSWGLVAVVWAWSVVPSVGPKLKTAKTAKCYIKLKPPKTAKCYIPTPPKASRSMSDRKNFKHCVPSKRQNRHSELRTCSFRSFGSLMWDEAYEGWKHWHPPKPPCTSRSKRRVLSPDNRQNRQNRHTVHEANGGSPWKLS